MRDHFPLLNQTLYFNTAYVGLPSRDFMSFRSTFDHCYLEEGDHFKIKGYERLAEQREIVASFIGSQGTHTFLTPNFSIGLRFFLDFLPSHTRFLTLKEDYPSLENAIRERGFALSSLPISIDVEDQIEAALAETTYEVLALSMVQYTSGIMIDAEALHRIKKRFPDLLIIADGTQCIGAEPFDFATAPFDLVAASGYKWLLAGFGNGFVTVGQRFLDYVDRSIESVEAKVYTGHFDFLGAASLAYAVTQLQAWNYPSLLLEKNKVAHALRQGLAARGLLSPEVTQRKNHAAIYNIPGSEAFQQRVLHAGIRCSYRGEGIRLSVHFYNTEEDCQRFFTVYDQLV